MDRESIQGRRAERAARRRKKKIIAASVFVVFLIGAVIFAVKGCSGGVVRDGAVIEVEIEQGQSTKAIANTLKEKGLISGVSGFLRAVEKLDAANSLRYGVYQIERGTGTEDIIKILSTGGSLKNSVTVTIPEGFSLERIIERLVDLGLSDSDTLYAAVKADYDYSFLKCIPDDADVKYRLQGFLFPSTYEFSKDADANSIINTMLAEFEKQLKKEGISEKNLYETITLASLVEREAKLDSERAKIAGVINNRISAGMLLQIDATVVYAISDGMYNVDRVLYKDLEVDSPYNTYKYKGLPSGPICSPGIKSIKASASPEEHSYYYYRTDTDKADGSHIFTETFEEHKSAGK